MMLQWGEDRKQVVENDCTNETMRKSPTCIRGAQEKRAEEIYHSCLHLHHKSLPFNFQAREQYKTRQNVIQNNLSTH